MTLTPTPCQSCTVCQRSRSCWHHLRAAFPPAATRRWLKASCPRGGKGCTFGYQAGVELPRPAADPADKDVKEGAREAK